LRMMIRNEGKKVLKFRIRGLKKDEDKTKRKSLKVIRSNREFIEED
jgi:hypothetical protein